MNRSLDTKLQHSQFKSRNSRLAWRTQALHMCIHEAHFDLFRSFPQPLHRIRTTSWKVLWRPSTRWCFPDTDVMPSIDIPSAAHRGSPQLKCTFGGSTCIPGMTLGSHVQDCYVENKGRSVRRTLQLFCIESASIEAQKCAFPDSFGRHSPKNTTMQNVLICFNRNRKQESKMDLSKRYFFPQPEVDNYFPIQKAIYWMIYKIYTPFWGRTQVSVFTGVLCLLPLPVLRFAAGWAWQGLGSQFWQQVSLLD